MINKKVSFLKFFPLLIFFLLILLAFISLQKYDRESLPSVLIGKFPPPLKLEKLGSYDLVDKIDLDTICLLYTSTSPRD